MSDSSKAQSNVPGLLTAFSAAVTTGGTIYAFGIYGDALKKSLGLSQLQLNAIRSVNKVQCRQRTRSTRNGGSHLIHLNVQRHLFHCRTLYVDARHGCR